MVTNSTTKIAYSLWFECENEELIFAFLGIQNETAFGRFPGHNALPFAGPLPAE